MEGDRVSCSQRTSSFPWPGAACGYRRTDHVGDYVMVAGVDVEILEVNEFGPKLAVRPYCATEHYWQVYFDTNMTSAETLGAAGFPVASHPA